jgi:hypothetical protein
LSARSRDAGSSHAHGGCCTNPRRWTKVQCRLRQGRQVGGGLALLRAISAVALTAVGTFHNELAPKRVCATATMEGDSEPVATAFHVSRSEAGADRAPADAWSSSKASAAAAQHTCSLLHECRRHLPRARDVAASLTAPVTPTAAALPTWLRLGGLGYGAEHVLRMRRGVRHKTSTRCGFSIGRMSGKGHLGVFPDADGRWPLCG